MVWEIQVGGKYKLAGNRHVRKLRPCRRHVQFIKFMRHVEIKGNIELRSPLNWISLLTIIYLAVVFAKNRSFKQRKKLRGELNWKLSSHCD